MSVRELEEAIYTRLSGDATLMALTGQGIYHTMHDGDDFDMSNSLTWITFAIMLGGDTHIAGSERFKDLSIIIEAHAQAAEGPEIILQMDDRIAALINGWTPTLASWSNVWPLQRTSNFQVIERVRTAIVSRHFGAFYRARFGQPT